MGALNGEVCIALEDSEILEVCSLLDDFFFTRIGVEQGPNDSVVVDN